MNNMKKISAIIVAYKNGEILKDALDSIHCFNDIGDDLEVVVVDNGPQDGKIRAWVSGSDIYLETDNHGFGEGNNRGAEVASGEILAFLNPDICRVEPLFRDIY